MTLLFLEDVGYYYSVKVKQCLKIAFIIRMDEHMNDSSSLNLTHWALDHIKLVWYHNSGLGFLKILNYVPKEREHFSAKNEPSFVTVKFCDDS